FVHKGPIVYELHRMPTTSYRRRAIGRIIRDPHGRVAVTSRSDRTVLATIYGSVPDTVVVVHQAGDPVPAGEVRGPDVGPGRPEAFQVGYVGTLKRWKGWNFVVELARRVPEIDVHLI